jgi:hypothetical protein
MKSTLDQIFRVCTGLPYECGIGSFPDSSDAVVEGYLDRMTLEEAKAKGIERDKALRGYSKKEW